MIWDPPETPRLDRVMPIIFRRLKRLGDDPRKLRPLEQTVVAVYGAQGVIDNGGFRYFFEGDWTGRPPYSFFSAAYRRIGAVKAANRLEEAVRLLPCARPHLATRKRNRFMDGLREDAPFFALDRGICGDATVWAKLERFVERNAAALLAPPRSTRRRRASPKK